MVATDSISGSAVPLAMFLYWLALPFSYCLGPLLLFVILSTGPPFVLSTGTPFEMQHKILGGHIELQRLYWNSLRCHVYYTLCRTRFVLSKSLTQLIIKTQDVPDVSFSISFNEVFFLQPDNPYPLSQTIYHICPRKVNQTAMSLRRKACKSKLIQTQCLSMDQIQAAVHNMYFMRAPPALIAELGRPGRSRACCP